MRINRVRDFLLLGALASPLLVSACDPRANLAAPHHDYGITPPVRTDRDEYRVTRLENGGLRVDIGARYTNRTSASATIAACHAPHPPTLQKLVGGRWITVYAQPVLLCITPAVVIRPRGSFDYTFRVNASPAGSNSVPQFHAETVPGTYRLHWHIREPHNDVSDDQGTRNHGVLSNEFRLVE